MAKKLTGKALAKFVAERDVWQEVLQGVKEKAVIRSEVTHA